MSYIDPHNKLLKHLDRIEMLKNGGAPPPINVEIDLSNRCSLGCEGCHFAHTHTRGPLAGSPKPGGYINTGDLMDVRLAKSILDQLQVADVRSVTWTGGGEPTLHPQFDEIIKHCQIPQGIYTNGAHISEARAEILKNRMTWVYVSLDYADDRQYNLYKKSRLYNQVIEGIKRLVAAPGQATIGVGYLLWRENWADIGAMYRLGHELGVDYIQYRPMVLHRLDAQDEVSEDTGWMGDMLGMLRYYAGQPKVIADLARFENYRNWNGRGYNSCWWSKLQTVITPDGKLWTCVNRRGFTGDMLGNLSTELFSEIWERHEIKPVDRDCRVMCRGHIPNTTLEPLMHAPQGHDLFV
jgi:MoaA/NifB/PqqE/SkfB family radical SAM enzyme